MLAEARQPPLPPPNGIAWGPRDILVALLLAFGSGFLLLLAIVEPVRAVTGSSDDPGTLTAGLVATMLFDVALFGAAAFFSVGRYHCSWGALGLVSPSTRALWSGLATALGGQLIVAAYAGLIQLIGVHQLLPGTNVPKELFDHRLVLPLTGVATVLVAPPAEETFFRGFMFGGLRRFGFFWAALGSGLLFSAAHLNPGGLIPLALVGMLFAWAYARTGTLWTTVCAHFAFNLASFVALTAQGGG